MSAHVEALDSGAEVERHILFGGSDRIIVRTISRDRVRLFCGALFNVSIELSADDAAALARQLAAVAAAIKARPEATTC